MPSKTKVLAGVVLAVTLSGSVHAQLSEVPKAFEALDRGDGEAAQGTFSRAAVEALLALAESQRGDAQKSTLARAAELVPADAEGLRQRVQGMQLLAEGKNAEAAALYGALATREPRDKRVQYFLGVARQRADDLPGAIVALREATNLDRAFGVALVALGDALRQAGDFGGAYNAYNHATTPDGRPVSALLGRAASRMLIGDMEGAASDLELAIKISAPGMDRYRSLMGMFFLRAYERKVADGTSRVEQAVAMWQELGRTDMAVAACNAAGRIFLETGDPDGGESWYQAGWNLVLDSKMAAEERTLWQVRMLHGTARAAAARRDFNRADSLVAQAKGLMDQDSRNAEHYAWIYPYLKAYVELSRRDPDAAIANLQAVPAKEMDRPYLQFLMAEAYSRKRDRDAARLWYEKALASATGLDPETVIVRPLAVAWLAKNPAKN